MEIIVGLPQRGRAYRIISVGIDSILRISLRRAEQIAGLRRDRLASRVQYVQIRLVDEASLLRIAGIQPKCKRLGQRQIKHAVHVVVERVRVRRIAQSGLDLCIECLRIRGVLHESNRTAE